jgi:hypothetical protein
MSDSESLTSIPFDDETWAQLPDFIGHLPERVCLAVWADPENGDSHEREAVALARTLAERFETIDWQLLPRRIGYPYYPVLGVMGGTAEEPVDYGVRIIGLPVGLQLTTLVAGIQAVAFRAQTLEPLTRIRLRKLGEGRTKEISIEMLTIADDETGAQAAKVLFGFAVAEPWIRVFAVMADQFPVAAVRYSADRVPHIVINRYVHHAGGIDEETLLREIGRVLGAPAGAEGPAEGPAAGNEQEQG